MNPAISHFPTLKIDSAAKARLQLVCNIGLLAVFLSASGFAHALQLGKHRGAAVVGQGLNIAIQATTDNADELASGCLDADVFYADNRVEKSKVRLTTEKSAANPQDVLIRIRSAVAIDEPVVTIYLRTGCTQKIEKRYVVLADVLSDSATGGAIALPSLPTQAGAARPRSQVEASAATRSAQLAANEERRLQRDAERLERKNKAAADQAAKAASTGSGASTSPAALAAAPGVSPDLKAGQKAVATPLKALAGDRQKSRLKLEPVELLAERDPALKTTTELRTAPTTDPAQRSAAAALWRAIAAQPEDILGDSQKLKALESAVSGLQVQMKKNELEMRSLGGDNDRAKTEKYANPLVYGLSLLLFLAAIGLAWTLRKRSAAAKDQAAIQPWWRKGSSQRVGWADSAENLRSPPSSYATAHESGSSSANSGEDATPENYLDLDLSDEGQKLPKVAERADRANESLLLSPNGTRRTGSVDEAAAEVRADFMQSASSGGRAVKAEELFDVQQQADFFVSLGQKDQAVDVLRSHIEESEETSALVYLDLLKLYHQLGEQLEFEAFRQEFNAKFNAEMPEFEAYSEEATGEGLQAYPLAMSRIVALWPSSKVLNVIEESMFRQPDLQTPTFDLEAYRELLLLYAMIKDILHAQAAGKGPTLIAAAQRTPYGQPTAFGQNSRLSENQSEQLSSNFAATSVVPLAATPDGVATSRPVDIDIDADADINVDVDLDNLGGSGAVKTSAGRTRSQVRPMSADSRERTALEDSSGGNGAPTVPGENSIEFDFDQPATADLKAKKLPGR